MDGGLSRQIWTGTSGNSLAVSLASEGFRKGTPVESFITETEEPQNQGDHFVIRWRGTITAPVSGDYQFALAADGYAQLWLGEPSGSKFTRRKIAVRESPSSWRSFAQVISPGGLGSNSPVISMAAGETRYIEVMMSEGTVDDHLSLAWKVSGSSAFDIIPGKLADGTVVLRGYVNDPLDADDDGLPDSWEQSVGLNIGDDGRINAADGGYSDWDQDGLTNYEEWRTSGDPLAAGGNLGVSRRDVWNGISGSSVAALTGSASFASPSSRSMVSGPLKFTSLGDSYGQRLSGVIVPDTTGSYHFWIAGDDSAELWLSTGASRLHKRKIAWHTSYTGPDAFDSTPSQKSAPLSLVAGQPYFYEILHKENGGGDHVSVAWGSTRRIGPPPRVVAPPARAVITTPLSSLLWRSMAARRISPTPQTSRTAGGRSILAKAARSTVSHCATGAMAPITTASPISAFPCLMHRMRKSPGRISSKAAEMPVPR